MPAKRKKEADVDAFLHALQHARKDEIEAVRAIVRAADTNLVERIKWNAPSYGYDDDRITFRLHPRDIVHLVFHRGAKKRTDPFVFEDESGLLDWLADDRAVVKFDDKQDVRAKKIKLAKLVARWIKATCSADGENARGKSPSPGEIPSRSTRKRTVRESLGP